MPDSKTPDFYNIESLLSEDERQVRDTVAKFVDDRVLPIIGKCFEEERFPSELVPEMAEMGLFGPTFQDYGCAGLNNVAYGLIMQELERGDSGLRSFASVQSGLVMVNLPTAGLDYHVPFGGRKKSSYGPREQGTYAKDFYTIVKTAYVAP